MEHQIDYSEKQLQIDFEQHSRDNAKPILTIVKQEEPRFKRGDIDNIASMLPKLFSHQHLNVAIAERRFMQHKGVMFTDGTGTGKTLSGLGIAYRFYHQNKKEILIVVPTDQKCLDWIIEGKFLELTVSQIQSIKDAGFEITVTTYANFYQNDALQKRLFDLIIYDESHYLGQNHDGSQTSYYEQHRIIANLPSVSRQKAMQIHERIKPVHDGKNVYYTMQQHYDKIVQLTTERFVVSTKVVFFSATPFAYHKSIKYVDGTLLDINEQLVPPKEAYVGYNEATGFDLFLMNTFGYQMRCGKITIPEAGVDLNLMERQFFESMKLKGVMHTKVLELDKDYSRDFVTLDSDIGELINSGMELFYEEKVQKLFPTMYEMFKKKYNYMYVNQLLECIKAREALDRIQMHLDLGRKVVLFHSYNHAAVEHPFRFDPYKLIEKKEDFKIPRMAREMIVFAKLYPQYYNLDLSSLKNTRDTVLQRFPDAKQFNGTVNKKLRNEYYKDFNNDYGNTKILLVQQKAGKEGISLHDTTGLFQRVLLQFGLPTEPTGCIQIEGRTYRQGVKSNCPYEYMTLQTTFERIAFGEKIALRSRTAENLAMGNLARNLEQSFKEGYLNSSYKNPSLEQGTGGKQFDRFDNEITLYDQAISFYYSRAKRNSKTKAKEGGDYFATPEPLGLKMVEWAKPKANEQGLEPSAGHGAIARFFPTDTTNHFIEQNINLTGELCINATGTVKIESFEKHSHMNKYEFIIMNPPFGNSGKLAMEHLEKAMVRHMTRHNSRIIVIVPGGPAMGKRVQSFFSIPDNAKRYHIMTRIKLPTCVFSRAGTEVQTNILHIVKNEYLQDFVKTKVIDLSYIQTINEFFEIIKDMEL